MRRRLRWCGGTCLLFVFVGAVASGGIACGAFGGSDATSAADNGTDGATSSSDAPTSVADASPASSDQDGTTITKDAAPPADAGDIVSDGLEQSTPGDTCLATIWACANCTTEVTTVVAHSGTRACKICRGGSNVALHINAPLLGEGSYTSQMWVMAAGDAGVFTADAGDPEAVVGGAFNGPSGAVEYFTTSHFGLVPSTWTFVQSAGALGPDSGATTVDPYLFWTPEIAQDCIYVDDVRFYRR